MIYVEEPKPEITGELIMAAVRLISDYCDDRYCKNCALSDVCDRYFKKTQRIGIYKGGKYERDKQSDNDHR